MSEPMMFRDKLITDLTHDELLEALRYFMRLTKGQHESQMRQQTARPRGRGTGLSG